MVRGMVAWGHTAIQQRRRSPDLPSEFGEGRASCLCRSAILKPTDRRSNDVPN